MNENLENAMMTLRRGVPAEQIRSVFSTSQRCAFGLAAGLTHLLPQPFETPGRAWLRLNDNQREAVRRWNPSMASQARSAAYKEHLNGFSNHGSRLPA